MRTLAWRGKLNKWWGQMERMNGARILRRWDTRFETQECGPELWRKQFCKELTITDSDICEISESKRVLRNLLLPILRLPNLLKEQWNRSPIGDVWEVTAAFAWKLQISSCS